MSATQAGRHWRGDERAGAETADGDAGDETAAIGKPLHQHSNGNDVAESKPESADEAIA